MPLLRSPRATPGVASREQGQTQQIRMVGCLGGNRSRDGRAVREGFQKEIISAPGGAMEGRQVARESGGDSWFCVVEA